MLTCQNPSPPATIAVKHLKQRAERHGIPLDASNLPWLQLGPVPWASYPFMGTSCKAYSVLRKQALVLPPTQCQACFVSPWHSALFRNKKEITCFSPRLIRKGVRTLEQLTEELRATLPRAMGTSLSDAVGYPTGTVEWPPPPKRHSRHFGPNGTTESSSGISCLTTPPLPPGKSRKPRRRSASYNCHRVISFVQAALRKKLLVGDMPKTWVPMPPSALWTGRWRP